MPLVKRLAAYGEPVEGTPFGRYRLVELLGRGGMGEVWRAHDTDTDRIVAIKLLPAHFSDNEEFQRRFRREAHAAARLNTPHVVPIHNYGEIDGRLYVDMRLIEGRWLYADDDRFGSVFASLHEQLNRHFEAINDRARSTQPLLGRE